MAGYKTVQYSAVTAVQCIAVQCSAVQYNTIQYNTIQYNTIEPTASFISNIEHNNTTTNCTQHWDGWKGGGQKNNLIVVQLSA